MSIRFKVWVQIEEVDSQYGKITDVDLPFAATAEFEKLDDAERFANALHSVGEIMENEFYP